MPNQSCSHTNFETSFPNTYWVEIAAPSASTAYLHCIDVTSSKFSHAATCVVWVSPTCRVIQSEEQSLDHVTFSGVFSINPHTPRRWNLAWLVLENPCQAQFRLEIEIPPAWACCARHNENPITIALILYNLVRSLTRLRRRL